MTSDLDLLRSAAGEWESSPAAEASARARLRAVIAVEQAEPPPRRERWRVPRWSLDLRMLPVARAGLAMLVLIVAATAVLGIAAPPPARARLVDLAEAAGATPVPDLAEGRFVYTRSEGVFHQDFIDPADPSRTVGFDVPIVREVWLAADGSGLLRATSGQPIFSDPADAAALTPDRAAALGLGQTFEQPLAPGQLQLRDWPEDVDELEKALFKEAAKGPQVLPIEVEVFDLATDILRLGNASPQLRAAVFRVLARLDGIDLEQSSPGTTMISISYREAGATEVRALTFADQGAVLVAESEAQLLHFPPPGASRTLVRSATTHAPPIVVDRLGDR